MRGGELDRKVTIQRKVTTVSDGGSEVETWSTLSLRHSASKKPIQSTEAFVDVERVAFEQVEFKVRYSNLLVDLSPLDRIVYPALDAVSDPVPERDVYDILGVHEIGRREGLRLIARRRPDTSA